MSDKSQSSASRRPVLRWRWDQGRLDYFLYENVVRTARVLAGLDGVPLDGRDDLLRAPLMQGVELPFAPSHYKVWRNYARVFACSMLATQVNHRLVVTDLCRRLANAETAYSPDQYLNFVFSRFTLPFPAFDDYNANIAPSFPFVATLKYVFSHPNTGATLSDVFSYVIGNGCTGREDLSFYLSLQPTGRKPIGDEERQVREMMVFMGQTSYLKWMNRRLLPDTSDVHEILKVTTPAVLGPRKPLGAEEFLSLTSLNSDLVLRRLDITMRDREVPLQGFEEGRRVFKTHGRIERSPLVRRAYFKEHPDLICDTCRLNVRTVYPWTENLLELHHVLPLSASINVNGTTTVLDDLVPLCPSCHKGIHAFYRVKFDEWGIQDFGSKKMAHDVYAMAKEQIERSVKVGRD